MATIIADRLHRPLAETIDLEAAIAPVAKQTGLSGLEADSLLLLATLAGATPETGAVTALAILGLRDDEGRPAHRYVTHALRELAMVNGKTDATVAAFKSTLAAVQGDRLAIVVSLYCTDGTETIVFDDGDGYRPDQDQSVGLSLVLPGRLMFRIAQDLLADD